MTDVGGGADGVAPPVVVYLAGVAWDAVPGTDRRLVERLSEHVPVLWVDPPTSLTRAWRDLLARRWEPRAQPRAGVTRLRTLGPPGVTRPGLRRVAGRVQDRAIRAAVGGRAAAIVVADPVRQFPPALQGRRCYYVTDDWAAGARLMGVSPALVEQTQRHNLACADVVAAVSSELAARLSALPPHHDVVELPNGCDAEALAAYAAPARLPDVTGPVAGLVGQVNERLDLTVLEALSDGGVPVVVVGPRTDRDRQAGRRLDAWLARDNVSWLGPRPPAQLPGLLRSMTVGLTPYADTAFNRASFPLKTLEYLAAGLPVIATDLPAVRWLASEHVEVAAGAQDFVRLAKARLGDPRPEEAGARRAFARAHSWSARADQMLGLLAPAMSEPAS